MPSYYIDIPDVNQIALIYKGFFILAWFIKRDNIVRYWHKNCQILTKLSHFKKRANRKSLIYQDIFFWH